MNEAVQIITVQEGRRHGCANMELADLSCVKMFHGGTSGP
jgi:hypothetical protein